MGTSGTADISVTDAGAPVGATRRNGKRLKGQITTFDFRRPNKVSREHVRALHIVQETFARQFSTILSTQLRTVSQVTMSSVDHMSYDDYIRNSPNPSFLTLFTLAPLTGAGILQIPLTIAMPAIDRLLGGPGDGKQPTRPLSDIETGLLREVVERVLHELDYAFESLTKIKSKALHVEANPQFAQITAPSEMVVVSTFDVKIGNAPSAEATLCIPLATLQPVLDQVTGQSFFTDRKAYDPVATAREVSARLSDAPVDVTVSFNEVVLTSDDILHLQPGDVLPLRHPVDAPLSVAASGRVCAHAVPGSKGRRLAFMVVPSVDKDSL